MSLNGSGLIKERHGYGSKAIVLLAYVSLDISDNQEKCKQSSHDCKHKGKISFEHTGDRINKRADDSVYS